MPEHNAITADADIHEPKGNAQLTAGATDLDKLYHSDGDGTGTWKYPVAYLTGEIADISTGSSSWVVVPYAGTIIKIYSVIDGATITADSALSFEIAGVAITSGGITVTQSGSAAGDVDSSTPSAANTVTAGQAVELITDGASGNTVKAKITLVIQRA